MPHSYETNYSSLKQSRFSVDNSRFNIVHNQRNQNDSFLSRVDLFDKSDKKSVGMSQMKNVSYSVPRQPKVTITSA